MKISTAEIKMLVKECVKTEGVYTTSDFAKYIELHSDKDFTRSQIAGALSQLTDTKDIVKIERGLYSRDGNSIKDNSGRNFEKKVNFFKENIYDALCKIENDIEGSIGTVNILELEHENFEIISKLRDLKMYIEDIKKECK